jgi:hypothetical protein
LSKRVKRSPDLDINLIRKILAILQENPYVHAFMRNGDFPNLDDYRVELNTNVTLDQRRYNAPTTSQVAAIWMEGKIHRDVLTEVWLYMERLIVIGSISEHGLVVMTH